MLIGLYYKLLGSKFGKKFIIIWVSIYYVGSLMSTIHINGTLSENQIIWGSIYSG
jgi:hypothetical protein